MITDTVTIHRPDADPMPTFLALPEGEGPHPAVLVVHEIYGLTDGIRDVARGFAEAGYVAAAVDLFSRGSKALCLMRTLGGLIRSPLDNTGLRDLNTALAWLRARPDVDPDRTAVTGFCMGGGFALSIACTDDKVRAVSAYYGTNPRPLGALDRACPVAATYPTVDYTTPMGRRLEKELEARGIPHDFAYYPGVLHGFATRAPRDDQGPAADAWRRTLAFFEEHVGAR